jgi:two-component system NtrC family sensor kinase
VIKKSLCACPYVFWEAGTGAAALALLREEEVDVVLLDYIMPHMDGPEVCRRIREDLGLADLPVIMLTSLDSPRHMIKGMDAGVTDYVTKPFGEGVLEAKIRAAIDG